jgi:MFS family permease
MTTRAITSRRITDIAQGGSFERRASRNGALYSIPGFLQLCASNGLAQSFGQRMQGIAVAWLVLEMTGSKFWLGVVNGVPAISIVLFSLFGGMVADSRDARRVLIISRSALAGVAFLLALVVSTGRIELSHLLVYVLIVVGIAAIDMPVSRNLVHDLVGSPRLLSASATQSIFTNVVNIVVPLSIGVLISFGGPGMAFWLLGGGYVVAVLMLLRMQSGSGVMQARHSSPLSDIKAGLAYVRTTPTVAALVGLSFLVPVAGIYFALVPVYAREVLNVGASGLGVLAASFSVGSLIGSIYLARHGGMRRPGLRLTLLGAAFGAGMMAFALSESFLFSCVVSFAMGLTAGLWQNTLGATVQVIAAPEMRGRVTGVFTMGFQLIGIGWLVGGLLAAAFGVEATVLGGGVVFSGLSLAVFVFSKETRALE